MWPQMTQKFIFEADKQHLALILARRQSKASWAFGSSYSSCPDPWWETVLSNFSLGYQLVKVGPKYMQLS